MSGLPARTLDDLLTKVGEVLARVRGGNSGSAGPPCCGRRTVALGWLYEGIESGEGLGRFILAALDEKMVLTLLRWSCRW